MAKPVEALPAASGTATVGDITAQLAGCDEPRIMRGLVADWPAVEAARDGSQGVIDYLRGFAASQNVLVFEENEGAGGRFFYNDDFSGFNFSRKTVAFSELLNGLAVSSGKPVQYMGSTAVDYCLPDFREHNDVDVPDLAPNVSAWIGGRSVIAPHFDFPDNLA